MNISEKKKELMTNKGTMQRMQDKEENRGRAVNNNDNDNNKMIPNE